MTRMRAADAAVAILVKEGAIEAFGLPGAAINPLLFRDARQRRHSAHPRPPRRGCLAHG